MTERPPSAGPRIVLVGNGMVATRFRSELRRHRVPARLTVLGEEPHAPYNRILLSEVIAGRADLGSLALPAPDDGAHELRGVGAVALDRRRRMVVDDRGGEHGYDLCVLATGAEAWFPPDRLLTSRHGVRVLRGLDDCRDLLAASALGPRVTVVGAGPLGVEVACGLRARGLTVTLVCRGDGPLTGWLSGAAADVARATLGDLGIEVLTGTELRRPVHHDQRLVAVELRRDDQPLRVPAELLVVCAGSRPRVEPARSAGLAVGRGIIVGPDLRSPDDPAVAAIGDCAETAADGCPGLLAPGWAQADRLAALLAGPAPATGPAEPAAPDLRLKAVGLDVVGVGAMPWQETDDGPRIVELTDRRGRRVIRIAVADDRVVAAVCVGAPEVAAELGVAHHQRTPLPSDPAELLVPSSGVAAAPIAVPPRATVCRCNGVDRERIDQAVVAGARTVADVARATRATTGCGGCTGLVTRLLEEGADRPDAGLTARSATGEPVVAPPKHPTPLAATRRA